MTTTGERLAQLSGLSGASTAEHLKRIAGAAGAAGALLVAYSRLPTGSAIEHLMAEREPERTDDYDVVLRRPRRRVRAPHRDEDVLLFIGAL